MMKIAVITVSDRVARGEREDLSGPRAVELLSRYGDIVEQAVVSDGTESVADAITRSARGKADVIFTTGGTGITGRDLTPEATAGLVKKRLTGLEARVRDMASTPYSVLSRGVIGIIDEGVGPALVINAPGSQGGVADAIDAIGPLLDHIVDQMNDGDHAVRTVMGSPSSSHFHAHEEITRRVQNRGVNDGTDASVVLAGVTGQAINMDELLKAVDDRTAGAVVSFCGQVRNHDDGRAVGSIDYQAHPDADKVIERVAYEVSASSGACKIAVIHREGHLEVGDVALGAAVSASHRAEAFRLLEEVIERVKMELPVWKKQQFEDGSHEWTGTA
ncbi:molybdenum cofactor biosynthesis protein MoaE [Actinomycetaceae bacterium MB13-C1-2]|nr:molybdenum cofactor biosynthesis protein MoaE [Actinomycetaceae bacterium MB13-C1-2]